MPTPTPIDTPLGTMLALFSTQGLCLLEFEGQQHLTREIRTIEHARQGQLLQHPEAQTALLREELAQYFSGSLKTFRTPLDMVGTPFQQRVWQTLLQIPYGETLSYKQQAERLGSLKAVRAVAAANGQNKISIIVPCHRVIGSNGSLTGYAGGLNRKQALLQLENPQNTLF